MQGSGRVPLQRLGGYVCTTWKRAHALSIPNQRRLPPQPRQLRCGNCGTEHHLTIHAVIALGSSDGDLVTVSYTCDGCRLFHEHPAYSADVSAALNQVRGIAGVMVFGEDFIHCGFPMAETDHEVERLSYRNANTNAGLSAISLPTRVLKCRCGFHLEVPE